MKRKKSKNNGITYEDVRIMEIPTEFCVICELPIKCVFKKAQPKITSKRWLEFYQSIPGLGVVIEKIGDRHVVCHGLCYWKNKLKQK